MAILSVFCAVALLAATSVNAHAKLDSPTAFNSQPSKTFQCGGSSSGVSNVVPTGSTQTLTWTIVAGDGAGTIRLLVDPTGGGATNFPTAYQNAPTGTVINVALTELNGRPTTPGVSYGHSFTLPSDLVCTGTGGVCTGQVSSESGWVACFNFVTSAQSSGGSSGTTAPQGTCQLATSDDVPACPTVAGKYVWVPTGLTLATINENVANAYNLNLPNANVFNNHQALDAPDTPCSVSYKRYLCGLNFPLCAQQRSTSTGPKTGVGSGVCRTSCTEFVCWCSLTTAHQLLYNCNAFSNAASDASGNCTRGFGAGNTPCTTSTASSSTGSSCSSTRLFCASASHTAVLQPIVLAAAALVTIAALYRRI